jgi:hypothetical protein
VAEITLRNGGVTLVDDADHKWLAQLSWAGYIMDAHGNRYAMTDDGGERRYMHRLIIGARDGLEVDHRNGDTLDNRRDNLREVTHQQNQQNRRCGYGSTGHRNVYRIKSGRYQVKLVVAGKVLSFGAYDTIEEAAFRAREARLIHMPFSDESATEIEVTLPDWRPCPIAQGYFVTRDGRIRNVSGYELRTLRVSPKTRWVELRIDGRRRNVSVEKLVAATFQASVATRA